MTARESDFEAAARAAAELDAQLDAEQPGPQPEPGAAPGEPTPELDEAARAAAELDGCKAALRMILEMAKLTAEPIFPTAAAIYTPAIIDAIADKGAAVMVKYGVTLGGEFGRWKEEIGLLFVLGPVLVATVKAVRLDLERRASDKAKDISPDPEVKPATDSLPADAAGTA